MEKHLHLEVAASVRINRRETHRPARLDGNDATNVDNSEPRGEKGA